MPTLVAPLQQLGARVGRCLPLPRLHALAFAMGTHRRLGAGAAGAGGGGRRMSRRVQGKEPDEGRRCAYGDMPEDLVRRVVEACRGCGREGGGGGAAGGGRERQEGGEQRLDIVQAQWEVSQEGTFQSSLTHHPHTSKLCLPLHSSLRWVMEVVSHIDL